MLEIANFNEVLLICSYLIEEKILYEFLTLILWLSSTVFMNWI